MNAPLATTALDAALTISRIQVRSVVVPLKRGVVTASGIVSIAPLMLVDVETSSGAVGHAYAFAYSPAFLPALASLTNELAKSLIGKPLAPQTIEAQLRSRFTLLGGAANLAAFAISAIDMAAWDAFARHMNLPLAAALGAIPKATKAYGGNGVGVVDAVQIPSVVDAVLADGVAAIKARLGRAKAVDDTAAVELVRQTLIERGHASMPLMVDFNQSLNVPEAMARCSALDAYSLTWIEEPTRCDDWRGSAMIAATVNTPIQIGENIASSFALQNALDAQATDFVMLDLQQLGGVTGWMRAASVANAYSAPISSHLFQEYSVHMLSATPGADWLEYFPIADALLAEPCKVVNGAVLPIPGYGSGIEWNESAVAKFAA